MKRFTRIPFLFCLGCVFALYARCICFSFIGLDDAAYTFRNPFVAGGLSVPNVVEAFTNLRHGGIWMPVTYISYMLDASICRWTDMPLVGEMHLVNVLLHVMNFVLLWKLIRQLFGFFALDGTHGTDGTFDSQQQTIALTGDTRQLGTKNQQSTINYQLSTIIVAMAAMIWALHPLRVEPVAWIAARKELLWTLFTLCGLIFWIKALTVPNPSSHSLLCVSAGDKNKFLTMLFCALACLSKPTAMCFPFLLLLVTWWMRKEDRRVANHQPPATNYQLITFFIIAAVTAAIAAYSQTHVAGRDSVALYAAPFVHRLVQSLSAIGCYLRATFWPFGLHVDCRAVPGLWPLDAGWNFAALMIAAVTALMCWIPLQKKSFNHVERVDRVGLLDVSTRSKRLIIFSALWFLISLSPTLGLFGNFGMEAHADRFVYLPSMALSFLLAGFLRRSGTGGMSGTIDARQPTSGAAIVNRDAEGGRVGARPSHNYQLPTTNYQLPTVIVIALLSIVTFQQLSHWRDDWAAHARVLACDPGHPRAMVHVADAHCSRKRNFDGGIRLYRKALSLAGAVPAGGFDVADTKARLAYALASRGGYEDFGEVKRLGADVLHDFRKDRRGMMLDALGTAFMSDGELNQAALLFKASLEAPDRFWPKAPTRRKLERCK